MTAQLDPKNKSLRYFYNLIDERGIVQFTRGNEKNYRYGYAVEDQARALILALRLNDRKLADFLLKCVTDYLNSGNRMFLLKSRHDKLYKDDSLDTEAAAEVYWALAEYYLTTGDRSVVNRLGYLKKGLDKSRHPRAIAYTLLGLTKLQDKEGSAVFADKLKEFFRKNSREEWPWFEDTLTYANALLPWALFESFILTQDPKILEIAERTMNFLLENLHRNDVPVVVGNQGWWKKSEQMALFDQQPIDVAYFCLGLYAAYETTNKQPYLDRAKFYFSWFNGNNLPKAKMILPHGGCADGLQQNGPNPNAGAESTICYLLTALQLLDGLSQSRC